MASKTTLSWQPGFNLSPAPVEFRLSGPGGRTEIQSRESPPPCMAHRRTFMSSDGGHLLPPTQQPPCTTFRASEVSYYACDPLIVLPWSPALGDGRLDRIQAENCWDLRPFQSRTHDPGHAHIALHAILVLRSNRTNHAARKCWGVSYCPVGRFQHACSW